MTTGAAVSFGIEALRLRSEVYEKEEKEELQDVLRRKGPGGKGGGGASFQLPPPPPGFGDPERMQWQGRRGWGPGTSLYSETGEEGYYEYDDRVQAETSVTYDSVGQGYDYGADGVGSSGQYVPAEYYDAAGYDDQTYNGSDDAYYAGSGASLQYDAPTEFEFPPGGEDGTGRSGPGRGQYDTGEDWD